MKETWPPFQDVRGGERSLFVHTKPQRFSSRHGKHGAWKGHAVLPDSPWSVQLLVPDVLEQACLRPRERFWDIPVPKIDSAFDNLFVPQPSWSPSTTQQL
ncbi:hypothetical protein, partial [Thiolapillus sp.]|uniref:hypothetical protein n=2 Tax=Thiolapillus sp. TaxID=2017437 RepID=UPI003AF532D4